MDSQYPYHTQLCKKSSNTCSFHKWLLALEMWKEGERPAVHSSEMISSFRSWIADCGKGSQGSTIIHTIQHSHTMTVVWGDGSKQVLSMNKAWVGPLWGFLSTTKRNPRALVVSEHFQVFSSPPTPKKQIIIINRNLDFNGDTEDAC